MDPQTTIYRELKDEIKKLHNCLDETRDEVGVVSDKLSDLNHGMKTFFLGIEPQVHVRHHNNLTDTIIDTTDKKRVSRETIGIIIATIVATIIINIGAVAYLTTNLGKQLNSPEHLTNIEQATKK